MTTREIIAQFKLMEREEQSELLHELIDLIQMPAQDLKQYSILNLEGIAEHLADGTDAQEYVNQLRSEWDHRP